MFPPERTLHIDYVESFHINYAYGVCNLIFKKKKKSGKNGKFSQEQMQNV